VLIENPIEGNAAYIFGADWRILSRLTKSELLQHHPHELTRVFHTGTWRRRLRSHLQLPKRRKSPGALKLPRN
jgi:hypothetical protein